MRLLILILISLTTITYASDDSKTSLNLTLKTYDCPVQASFWEELGNIQYGIITLGTEEAILMKLISTQDNRRIYQAAQNTLPSVELSIPSVVMSSLPELTVSYSGVQYTCYMSYQFNPFSNVGSIGHGR